MLSEQFDAMIRVVTKAAPLVDSLPTSQEFFAARRAGLHINPHDLVGRSASLAVDDLYAYLKNLLQLVDPDKEFEDDKRLAIKGMVVHLSNNSEQVLQTLIQVSQTAMVIHPNKKRLDMSTLVEKTVLTIGLRSREIVNYVNGN